jgi:PPOX class probable F420-dependent enzyme
MNADDARRFVDENPRSVLATHRADGGIQMSPILAGLDGDGHVVISTREPTAKVSNLRRDPRASICVLSDAFFGPWIRVDGEVEIVWLPDAMELLVDYYRRLQGEHDDWDEYRDAMREQERVLLQLTITEVGGPGAS